MILKGNVIPKAIGRYKLGLDLGLTNRMAAGTAIYEALAAKIAQINRFPSSGVIHCEAKATTHPLIAGITIANITGNHPLLKKFCNF